MIIKNIFKKRLKIAGGALTLAKFLSAMSTILIVAYVKYTISGSFHIEYSDFWQNVGIGCLGWTVNTGLFGILTEHFGLKGINFNLYQLLFGLDSMKMNGVFLPEINKPSPKLYNAMESEDILDGNRPLDKGKNIDREVHPNYEGGRGPGNGVLEGNTQPQDKGKQVAPASEPPFSTWSRIFPGLDPSSVFFPKKINPGSGFNVPGGEVPIQDGICQHIDYNSHILNQFKNMDLETAITQRNNYLAKIRMLDEKIIYAKEALAKVPAIPTTEYEFKIKNHIIEDLNRISKDKIRSEARVTLLNSRIQFIEIQINNNPN